MESDFAQATARVDNDPDLSPYRDIIIETDWPETDHLAWVATAPKTEIVEWAEIVRLGMDEMLTSDEAGLLFESEASEA